MNWQENHQGVKHRKYKEKYVFVPNNSSLLQVKVYLPYTYIIFFSKDMYNVLLYKEKSKFLLHM